MRKSLQKSLIIAGFAFISMNAHATVGGPTYIHSFTYNPANESVYYVETSYNGRGCPPILKRISLNTNKIDTVYSCGQAEKLNDPYDSIKEIEKITAGFKKLSQINLSKNAIQIDVNYYKDVNVEYPVVKEFVSTIYQEDNAVATQTITGCTLDQPFTYAGYAIPGFNQKIIMLVSGIEDCFEGGYISESPVVVGSLINLNKEFSPSNNKSDSALVQSVATRTVFESEKIVVSPNSSSTVATTSEIEVVSTTTPDTSPEGKKILLYTLSALVVGVFVGSMMRKNKIQ